MISLSFSEKYRSILIFPDTELPDFTVITGINGSGKSHFLEAIKNKAIKVEGVTPNDSNIRLFSWSNLVPQEPEAVDPSVLKRQRVKFIEKIIKQFSSAREGFIDHISQLKHYLSISSLEPNKIINLSQTEFLELQNNSHPNVWAQFQQLIKNAEERGFEALGGNKPYVRESLLEYAKKKKVSVLTLTEEEIKEVNPLDWSSRDIFQQNLSQIFAAYRQAQHDNEYNEYLNARYSRKNIVFSNEEFRERFGEPPWNLVNRLLEKANLDYQITYPNNEPYTESVFETKLINKTNNSEVSFHDLSSGEKIIMSFALCLYNINDKAHQTRYPNLLLLDEIDAPLHPSMTKNLIEIIEKILVKEKGIKVILTTHSPATVSLSPSTALFRLDKQPRALTPCTREHAIQELTSGYISVTENSRFIITEAKPDKIAYTAIVQKLIERGKLLKFHNLIFIQASDKKNRDGGREQVKKWSSNLQSAGLEQILGLIDRDQDNKESDYIKVIRRHSLENYLLDPIILYAALMDQGVYHKIFDAGLKDKNYFELQNVEQCRLQEISDAMCLFIEKKIPELTSIAGKVNINYISGKSLELPAWLEQYPGHDLEKAIDKAFAGIVKDDLTRNDYEYLIELLDRLPEFISMDLLEIFMNLQSGLGTSKRV